MLQEIEFWTNMGDGTITGDAPTKLIMTNRLNQAFERIMPFLYSWSNYLKWDDTNNLDQPIGTFSIVANQPDYTIAQDADSLAILNITGVRILQGATGTFYYDLKEMTSDDRWAQEAMSPNTTITGIPTNYLKRGNTVYLFPQPNYSATNGCKIYFERQASYFKGDNSDDTKVAGIPLPFQDLLPLYASHDWLITNKPDNTTTITRLELQIQKRETALKNAIDGRNPHRAIISSEPIAFR